MQSTSYPPAPLPTDHIKSGLGFDSFALNCLMAVSMILVPATAIAALLGLF